MGAIGGTFVWSLPVDKSKPTVGMCARPGRSLFKCGMCPKFAGSIISV